MHFYDGQEILKAIVIWIPIIGGIGGTIGYNIGASGNRTIVKVSYSDRMECVDRYVEKSREYYAGSTRPVTLETFKEIIKFCDTVVSNRGMQ